jgi:hypothetical protein
MFFSYWYSWSSSSSTSATSSVAASSAVPVLPPLPPSISLQPVVVGPARNIPFSSVKQITPKSIIVSQEMIYNTKLKKAKQIPRRKKFEPRHPVLQELIATHYRKEILKILCQALEEFWQQQRATADSADIQK